MSSLIPTNWVWLLTFYSLDVVELKWKSFNNLLWYYDKIMRTYFYDFITSLSIIKFNHTQPETEQMYIAKTGSCTPHFETQISNWTIRCNFGGHIALHSVIFGIIYVGTPELVLSILSKLQRKILASNFVVWNVLRWIHRANCIK